ncbi:MAG TPA: hypothetical protein VMZ53_15285 [Kofleriaceae bacterium]|nr:hypothetical protein [Kofleriaceae bacterium]
MSTNHATELSLDDLSTITGGFGLRSIYREAVKGVTAGIGGWKLANEMYGTPEHGAPWAEKKRAMSALKGYLDASDKLPSWAPNW